MMDLDLMMNKVLDFFSKMRRKLNQLTDKVRHARRKNIIYLREEARESNEA